MLRHLARAHPARACFRRCSTRADEVPELLYLTLSQQTLDQVQEVLEDFADATPALEVDVECAVRGSLRYRLSRAVA